MVLGSCLNRIVISSCSNLTESQLVLWMFRWMNSSLHYDIDFKEKEAKEVAKIRFQHYQIKRFRKLQVLHGLLEIRIHQRRQEKEKADKEYY